MSPEQANGAADRDFDDWHDSYADNDSGPSTPSTAIDCAWKPLDEDLLLRQPEARRWLLRHPTRDGHPCAPCTGDGLLPLGKAGLLVADGGVGKTLALCALGVSIVTGHKWFGHFEVETAPRRGRVLLALAEEDEDEIDRRLYSVAQAYELDAEQRRDVARRIMALPLAGHACPLVVPGFDGKTMIDSLDLIALRKRLEADAGDAGWSLIALDPYSRLSGPEAEIDNSAATRTMQAAESLVAAPGGPAVLMAHHVSLVGVQTGAIRARGVTGIRNAARWEATLRADGADVMFVQSKSNYSRPMLDELRLVRGPGGVLRAPTSSEAAERAANAEAREVDRETAKERAKDARHAAKLADLVVRVVRVASREPRTGRELGAAAGIARREDVLDAIHAALAARRLVAGHRLNGHDRYFLPGASS